MGSKQHWKDRARRFEKYRDEVAAERSQALADLDREAKEVELLRTVVNEWLSAEALTWWPVTGRWSGQAGAAGTLSPELVEAIVRAQRHAVEHSPDFDPTADDEDEPALADLMSALGGVPLEELPPGAQERAHVRLAQLAASPMAHHRRVEEADATVTLHDAAQVITSCSDMLEDPDRELSLATLALLLRAILPRVAYQAGAESELYQALHQVQIKYDVAAVIADGAVPVDDYLPVAAQVLDVLAHHIPKLASLGGQL